MSLQAVEKVVKSEQKNRERRAAAEQRAKQMAADAQRNGQALLDKVRADAEAEGKALLQQAEARAEERSNAIRAEAEKHAEKLRAASQSHLDAAVELIVGRVVR